MDVRLHFMDRTNTKLVKLSTLLGFLLLAILSFGSQKAAAGKHSPSPVAPPPMQQQPLPPAPLPEQMPATAPQVSFKSGELTIVARNSSLGVILQAVETQTGASIDMPGTPSDRVVGQFGPGPAREVLAALLNGSHFNYVLLGSPQNPNVLQRVVLLAKSSTSDEPSAPAQAASAFSGTLPRQGAFVVPNQDDDPNAQDDAEDMAEPEQPAEVQNGPNVDQNGQPAIKTPQQLLQELQQQRQAQPGQPGGPQGTPALQGGPPQ